MSIDSVAKPVRDLLVGSLEVKLLTAGAILTQSELWGSLTTKETELVESVRSRRRKIELLRSRWLFHHIGQLDHSLVAKSSGEPNWPEGTVGSLSHKFGHVAMMVQSQRDYLSVGVDLEMIDKISRGVGNRVCDEGELRLIDRIASETGQIHRQLVALVFSAKETIYKIIYPIGHIHFYFDDASTRSINPEKQAVTLRIHRRTSDVTPKDTEIEINYDWLTIENKLYVVTCGGLGSVQK